MSFHESCKQLDAGIDGRLSTYITRTKAIELLGDVGSRAVVAVGLKGIGKSSAYRYLTEFSRRGDEVIIGIDPDKYTVNLPNKDRSYTICRKQFEHDIVIEALRGIVAQEDKLKLNVPNIKSLITQARREVTSYLDALKKFVKRGGGISVLGCGFSVGKSDEPVLIGLRENSEVQSALDTLCSICAAGLRIRIVVDDPEQVFSASRTLDTHLVGGFCLAAIRLSEAVSNLKIVALFKTHVYQPIMVDVDDLTRYPEHMVRLRWSADELIEVVQRRLDAEKQKWSDIFVGSVSQGKALLTGELNNITRNGPRDLLHTLDIALQNSKVGKIGKAEIDGSREKASQDSLDELTSAYSSLYRDLGSVAKAVFRTSARSRFTIKELRGHIQTLMVNDEDMKALSKLPWMQSRSSQTLPQLFFETGLLALDSGNVLTLPFDQEYTLDRFRGSKFVRLVPALVSAVVAQ
jgi:hypothetical protein